MYNIHDTTVYLYFFIILANKVACLLASERCHWVVATSVRRGWQFVRSGGARLVCTMCHPASQATKCHPAVNVQIERWGSCTSALGPQQVVVQGPSMWNLRCGNGTIGGAWTAFACVQRHFNNWCHATQDAFLPAIRSLERRARYLFYCMFVCLFGQRVLSNPRADSRHILHAGVAWVGTCLLPFWGSATPRGGQKEGKWHGGGLIRA